MQAKISNYHETLGLEAQQHLNTAKRHQIAAHITNSPEKVEDKMRTGLVIRALSACLNRVVTGVRFPSLFTSKGETQGELHEDALSQFGIALKVSNSSIERISANTDENSVISVNLEGISLKSAFATADPPQTRRSFWLQSLVFRKLAGDIQIQVNAKNITIEIEGKLSIGIREFSCVWQNGSFVIILSDISARNGDFLFLQKDKLEFGEGDQFHVESLHFDVRPDHLDDTIQCAKLLRCFFISQKVENVEILYESEQEKNEVEKITRDVCENAFEIVFDDIEINAGFMNLQLNRLKLSGSGFVIEKVNLRYFENEFTFERIGYERPAHKFGILKFSSNVLKQTQAHFPFLVTRSVRENYMCTLANLNYVGSFLEAKSMTKSIMSLCMACCQLFHGDESVILQMQCLNLFLEGQCHFSCGIRVILKEGVCRFALENGELSINSAPLIVSKFSMQISDDGKIIRVLVSPSDIRATYSEVEFLAEKIKTLSAGILPFEGTREMELNIVTTDIILCREVQNVKHNFLMVSFNDIVMRAFPRQERVDSDFTVVASLRSWNPQTSFWDYVVQPFDMSIFMCFSGKEVKVNVKIASQLHVCLSPRILNSLISDCDENYGSQTVQIANFMSYDLNLVTHKKVVRSLKFSGSNPNIRKMEIPRDGSCHVVKEFKGRDESSLTIHPGEVRVIDVPVSTPIKIANFDKTFRINQILFPSLIERNVVLSPVLENGGKVLQFSHQYSFHNSYSESLTLFLKSGSATSVQEIRTGGKCPVFGDLSRTSFALLPFGVDSLPKKWYKLSDLPLRIQIQSSAIVVSRHGDALQSVFEIRPLYRVQNCLPFNVICTFISVLHTGTVDLEKMTGEDLCLESDDICDFNLTCCINPLGATDPFPIDRVPLIESLSLGTLEFCVSIDKNEFHQNLVTVFGYVTIIDSLDREIFVKCGENRLYPVAINDNDKKQLLFMPGTTKCLTFSLDEDSGYVQLPLDSSRVDFERGNGAYFPVFVEVASTDDGRHNFEIKPVLMIRNDLDMDMKFGVGTNSFVIQAHQTECPAFISREMAFSMTIESEDDYTIDTICLSAPTSTVFRFSDGVSQLDIHLQVELINGVLIATFEKASLPYPFMIVNELPNVPIFAQQTETAMPLKIEPNSATFFPLENPFSEPAVMLTISGKSQLVPLHSDIEGTLLSFTIGALRLVVDVVTLHRSVRALIIGTKPFVRERWNTSFSLHCNDLVVSLLTSELDEFLLGSFGDIVFECDREALDFSIGSCQLDNQTCGSQYGVVARGLRKSNKKWMHCFISHENLMNIRQISISIQPIELQLDYVFLRAIFDYVSKIHGLKVLFDSLMSSNGSVLTIQQFEIHPITISASYINNSGNRRSSGAGTVSSRSATIGCGSFSASDLNITPACLKYILIRHYEHFLKSALHEFRARRYTEKPVLLLSRFQCSSLLSEFYQDRDSRVDMADNDRMATLPRIDVFPVLRGDVFMSIDYSRHKYIHFLQQEVTTIEQQRLGKRRQPQRTYPYRITNLTPDQITVEAMTRKHLRATNEIDKIMFVEYCGLRHSIICFTSKYTFLHTVPAKNPLARFKIDLIQKVELSGKRLSFDVLKSKGWRKVIMPIFIDFETEEIAEQAHLLVTTLRAGVQ